MNTPRILITSPSLNVKENVSGISSLVSDIILASKCEFIHLKLGSRDNQKKNLSWALGQFFNYTRAISISIRSRFRILHLNLGLETFSIVRDFFVFLIVKNLFRKKVLLHIHGGFYLMNPPGSKVLSYFLRVLFQRADCIVVLSEKEKKILGDRYGRSDISVMPNAVNLSFLESRQVKPIALPLKLIFMGRISKSKGIYVIAESFRYLEDHFDKFSLEIYGAGPELESWLKQLSGYKGLNFFYKGIASGKLKWDALQNADVFLLPSIHSEGMPIALIEAMAAGCTSIVTDDASITSIVTANENGIVIKKNDPYQVAQKLREIIEGRLDNRVIGKRASDYIHQHLSISTYAHRLDQLYSEMN